MKDDEPSTTAAFLQRFGDVCLIEDSDFETAKHCYEAILEFFRYLGMRRHIADCLMRLGLVYLLEGDNETAKIKLSTARRFYISAEDPEGCRYCEARLEDVRNPEPKVMCSTQT